MYRMLGMAAVAVFALGTAGASAADAEGPIERIDLTTNTFSVNGILFTASAQNTVGPTLEELKVGDKVDVFYEDSGGAEPYNAVTIEKMEE